MTKKTTAVATTDSTRFAVCDPTAQDDLASLLAGGVGVFDLTRLKVPASGATAFEIDKLEGMVYEQEIECVIVLVQGGQRAWWRDAYGAGGGGTPPDCSSSGSGMGMGNPMGEADDGADPVATQCASCHWNQWKTAIRPDGTKGRGKACKEWAMVFFYMEGSGIPMMLSVPPSSLGVMRSYSTKLLGARKPVYSVVTKLALTATKNADGTAYSEITFSYGGDLSPEGSEAAKGAQVLLKDYIAKHAITPDLT